MGDLYQKETKPKQTYRSGDAAAETGTAHKKKQQPNPDKGRQGLFKHR